jgi:hypothetical protein
MNHVSVRRRWRATWFWVGLPLLVLLTWGGSAQGQTLEQTQNIEHQMESYGEVIRTVGTGIFVLGIVVGFILVGMLAVRIYLRSSATTDPMKLAMSDPWMRANLERWQAAQAGGAPAEGAVATQAETSPAEAADVPAAPAPS